MFLKNPMFRDNLRIRNAALNAPPMRRGERDKEAVRILQNALIAVKASTMRRSIRPDGTLDGDYGSETVAAVARFQGAVGQAVNGSKTGDGIAGRLTWKALDERAPHRPVPTSITAAPLITPRAETLQTQNRNKIVLPTKSLLLREYEKFREVDGRPCGQGKLHQCAVRMSVALMRSDIGFYFDDKKIDYTHTATNPKCGTGTAHNMSSRRLFNYLASIWQFQRFKKSGAGSMTWQKIRDAVSGKAGIVFFEKCFSANDPDVGGNHIDLWDGKRVMNDRMNYNGPGEHKPEDGPLSDRWFRDAKGDVYFLAIPG